MPLIGSVVIFKNAEPGSFLALAKNGAIGNPAPDILNGVLEYGIMSTDALSPLMYWSTQSGMPVLTNLVPVTKLASLNTKLDILFEVPFSRSFWVS